MRVAFAVGLLLLCLPAILSWSAGDFDDLRAYVAGGHAIIDWLESKLSALVPVEAASTAAGGSGAGTADGRPEVSGLRSVTFSLLAYWSALVNDRFGVLVLLQASAAFWLLFKLFSLYTARPLAGAIASAGLLPAIAFGVSRASPDIWAGLLVLALLLLLEGWGRLRRMEYGAAWVLAALGVSFHASHLPLGAAVVAAWLAVSFLPKRSGAVPRWSVAAGGLAVAAGAASTALAGFIGFGEVSVAPKRYPIALARSIEDGPALWHLQEHCDTYNYTVCEMYPEGIPTNVGAFLWSDRGVANRATPEQMDQLREEEVLILQRASQEYPYAALRRAAGNVGLQLVRFDLNTRTYRQLRSYVGDGKLSERYMRDGWWLPVYHGAAQLLHFGGVLLGLAALLWAACRPGRLTANQVRLLAVTLTALAANAVVCGALSAPVDRYQVRVIWLLPLSVMIIYWRELLAWVEGGLNRDLVRRFPVPKWRLGNENRP
jgi:hypothetical protein